MSGHDVSGGAGDHEFDEADRVSAPRLPDDTSFLDPHEFVVADEESAPENQSPTVVSLAETNKKTISEKLSDLGHKYPMRLLVGVPIVYASIILYLILPVGVILSWWTPEDAKDIGVLYAPVGTLAATIVGFFFGGKDGEGD